MPFNQVMLGHGSISISFMYYLQLMLGFYLTHLTGVRPSRHSMTHTYLKFLFIHQDLRIGAINGLALATCAGSCSEGSGVHVCTLHRSCILWGLSPEHQGPHPIPAQVHSRAAGPAQRLSGLLLDQPLLLKIHFPQSRLLRRGRHELV